jgi:SAM-dependent methyltransferase
MLRSTRALLAHPRVYLALQRALRADTPRYRCLTELGIAPGHAVLDVGCGPAYYVPRLPAGVNYHGFDTDLRYITWAREKFGARGTFHLDMYSEEHRRALPPFDRVLLMGLLHHLDDGSALELLRLIGRSLAPGGAVMALDTCLHPQLTPVQRWLAVRDRGQHVRGTGAFVELAEQVFGKVEGHLDPDASVPVRLFFMRMESPL